MGTPGSRNEAKGENLRYCGEMDKDSMELTVVVCAVITAAASLIVIFTEVRKWDRNLRK